MFVDDKEEVKQMEKKRIAACLLTLTLVLNLITAAAFGSGASDEPITTGTDVQQPAEKPELTERPVEDVLTETAEDREPAAALSGAAGDLARGLTVQYKAAANKGEYPDRSEGADLKLATDGDSSTYYTTGQAELGTGYAE